MLFVPALHTPQRDSPSTVSFEPFVRSQFHPVARLDYKTGQSFLDRRQTRGIRMAPLEVMISIALVRL